MALSIVGASFFFAGPLANKAARFFYFSAKAFAFDSSASISTVGLRINISGGALSFFYVPISTTLLVSIFLTFLAFNSAAAFAFASASSLRFY